MIKEIINTSYADDLVFYDQSKFKLKQFTPSGSTSPIRFFQTIQGGQIPSRSAISGRREPFMVSPEIQILIDNAKEYGSRVDDNIENFVNGLLFDEKLIDQETKDTIEQLDAHGLIWVARSVMICHPDGLGYGEIDELLYDKATDTYYVGDTKTSSSVDKIGYWYQLAMYVEILRLLNPGKNISSIGVINHIKYRTFKWQRIQGVEPSEPSATQVGPDHPRYNAMWTKGPELDQPELVAKAIVKRDLEEEGVLKLVQLEFKFIKEMKENFPEHFAKGKVIPTIEELLLTPNDEKSETLRFYTEVDAEITKIFNKLKERYEPN